MEPTAAPDADADADSGIPEPTGSISLGKPLLESVGSDGLEEGNSRGLNSSKANSSKAPPKTWVSRLGPSQSRLIGIIMALVMGCFFGFNFDPAQYLMDNVYDDDDGHRVDPLDYVFR